MFSVRSKSVLCILLALSLLFSLCALVACEPSGGDDTTLPDASGEDTAPDAPAELVLVEDGKTDFSVIRPEDAVGYYLGVASTVYRKLESVLGADFDLSDDWINPREETPENAHEILLFDTNRAESVSATADLNFDGYIIRTTDCKVVIVCSGLVQCNAALHYFFDTMIPEYTKDGRLALPVGLEVKNEVSDDSFDLAEALASGKSIATHIEEVFNYKGADGFASSQGVATDGKYAYSVIKKKDGSTETDKIVKIDMETWEIVKISEELPLDHANDMTYDPSSGQLVVVHMLNCRISFIDTETLQITKTVTHPFFTSSIASHDSTGRLLLRSGASFIYVDRDLNQVAGGTVSGIPEYADKYVGQGMDMDDNYMYIPRSGTHDNIILICDLEGKLLSIATLATDMESESIFHVGDKFYIQFNYKCSTICTLQFCENFE